MNATDSTAWLDGRELADPRTIVTAHIAAGPRHRLRQIARRPLIALCGASLDGPGRSPEPSPDSPVCRDCARILRPKRVAS